MPWVLLKQQKTGADVVKTIYMILMFMERWGPAAGCGGCSLVDSERTQVKGLKKQMKGGGSIRRLRGGRKNERGQGVGSVPGTVVVFPWS